MEDYIKKLFMSQVDEHVTATATQIQTTPT